MKNNNMLDKIIRESIYRLIEEDINDVSLIKDSDNHGNFGYFIVNGQDVTIGQIRISELSEKDIIRIIHDEYMTNLFNGITFPAYFLDCFFILNEYRKFGYGKKLLNEVIKDFGKYTLVLQAGTSGEMSQEELVGMYQRYGFKHGGRSDYGAYMVRFPKGIKPSQNTSFDIKSKRLEYEIMDALKYNICSPLVSFDTDDVYNMAVAMEKDGKITRNDIEKLKMLMLRCGMIDRYFE